MFTVSYDAPLMHHGVKGMKWGVRRYQNRDGSLTSAGRAHYGKSGSGSGRSMGGGRASGSRRGGKKPLTAAQKAERKRKLIKGAKIAAAALGTAAVVGGTAYLVGRHKQNQQDKFAARYPLPKIPQSMLRNDPWKHVPGSSAGREHSAVAGGFKTGSNKGSYNPATGEFKGVYDSRIPRHTNSPKGSYTSPFARSNPDTSRGLHINTSSMRDDSRTGRSINGFRVQERPGASAGREHSAVAGGFKTGSNKGSYNPTTGEYKGVYDSRIPTHTNSPKGSFSTYSARASEANKAAARAARADGVATYRSGANRSSSARSVGSPYSRNGYSEGASRANARAASAARNDGAVTYRPTRNKGMSVGTPYSRNGYSAGAAAANARAARAQQNDGAVMYRPRSSSGDRVQAANAHAQASTARARAALEKRRRRYG